MGEYYSNYQEDIMYFLKIKAVNENLNKYLKYVIYIKAYYSCSVYTPSSKYIFAEFIKSNDSFNKEEILKDFIESHGIKNFDHTRDLDIYNLSIIRYRVNPKDIVIFKSFFDIHTMLQNLDKEGLMCLDIIITHNTIYNKIDNSSLLEKLKDFTNQFTYATSWLHVEDSINNTEMEQLSNMEEYVWDNYPFNDSDKLESYLKYCFWFRDKINELYSIHNRFIDIVNDLFYYTIESYLFIGYLVKIKNVKDFYMYTKKEVLKITEDYIKFLNNVKEDKENIYKIYFKPWYTKYCPIEYTNEFYARMQK